MSVLPRVSGREVVAALAKGMLRAIVREAGLTVEELKDLLRVGAGPRIPLHADDPGGRRAG